MSRIFLTSDTHWMHDKSFLYEPRGYSSIEEHDENVIRIWNEVVNPDDIVYHLGDIYMTADHEKGCELINKLNGEIHLIAGNHDTDNKLKMIEQNCSNVIIEGLAARLKYKHQSLYLSHYPSLVGNYDDDLPGKIKVTNLCGHSHSKDRWSDFDKGLIYHVEWDAHGAPKLLDEIINEIKEKTDEL